MYFILYFICIYTFDSLDNILLAISFISELESFNKPDDNDGE